MTSEREKSTRSVLAAASFGVYAALWAGGCAVVLGYGPGFFSTAGPWQIVLITAACVFVCGILAHLVCDGSRSVLRATLSGALTPVVAIAAGTAVIAFGAWLSMVLTAFAVLGLPSVIVGAVLGAVYGVAQRWRTKRGAPSKEWSI